jgi:Holliday junction resolvase RusA-like endonuclease
MPPSLNRARRWNKETGVPYPSENARNWKRDAYALMLEAGFRPYHNGTYRLTVDMQIYCASNRDPDNCLKLLYDVSKRVLAIDDSARHMRQQNITTEATSRRADHRIDVTFTVERREE